MPPVRYVLMLGCVILAAGLTVAALAAGAPQYFPLAALAATAAAILVRFR